MGPAELVSGLAAASLAKDAIAKLIDLLLEAGGGSIGKHAAKAFRQWKTERGLKQLHTRSRQIRRVKTLWQVEREIDLSRFYYASKIRSSGHVARPVHQIAELPIEGNTIIRGTVGQGKSIFLRYLAARELQLGEHVPVFLELRRLRADEPLVDHVIEELKSLGIAHATLEVFEALAESGKLVLLLDGFDEVFEARVPELVDELEHLSERWESLRILVTSRPDSALEHSPLFRVGDLAPLIPGEYAKVVECIAHDPKLAAEIVAGVRRGHESIERLLTTPLMVALLVNHYRVGQGIPENRVAFYEPIFLLLLQRHDKAKAGYVRTRHSKLADHELEAFFSCLCFVTRRDRVSVMNRRALIACATRALKWLAFPNCKPDEVADDIVRITCLILKEGDEYRFLHKSVQEFHAACFVRDQPDGVVCDFYNSLQRCWGDWQQELVFLETIDPYRFNRYFAVPLLEQVVSTLPSATPIELGRALIGRLTLRVTAAPQPEAQHPIYPLDSVGWCLTTHFDGSPALLTSITTAATELARSRNGASAEHREIAAVELFPRLGKDHPPLLEAAERLGNRLRSSLDRRKKGVHVIEERRGLFEL